MEDIYTDISNFFRNLFYPPVREAFKELGVDGDIANNIEIVIAAREEASINTGDIKCTFVIPNSLTNNGGVNSMSFKLDDKQFVKIQLSDQTDPLINEVIINQIINQNSEQSQLFSKYIDHCICTEPTGIYEGKQALVTEYMDITTLGEMFETMPLPSNDVKVKKQYCAFLNQLDLFVGEYMKVASTIGFTHNDMHMGNVVIHESKFKVIDYGRSCLNKDKVACFDKILRGSCAKYGLLPEKIKDLFPSPLSTNTPASSSKHLAYYQIVDFNYGYMTDIASLCFMVLPNCGSLFTWPNCIEFDPMTETFTVQLDKGRNDVQSVKYKNLYEGLYFLAAYITASNVNSSRNPISIHMDEILKTIFWINGICKNTEYHKVKGCVHKLYDDGLKLAKGQNSSSGGGGGKGQRGGTTSSLLCARKKRIKAYSISTNTIITGLVRQNFDLMKTNLMTTNPCVSINHRVREEAAAATGGRKKKKTYIVHMERNTKKKYILRNKIKWYLSAHKGKYTYVNDQHTHLQLKGSKINILKQ